MDVRKKSSGRSIPTEEWFADLYRTMPPPTEAGEVAGCDGPDDEFLRRLANSSRKPSLLDPRVKHVTQCPYCLKRLMELRKERSGKQLWEPSLRSWMPVFAVFACAVGLFFYLHKPNRAVNIDSSPSATVSRTLDLSREAPTRGVDQQLPITSIPSRSVDLTLILPALSEAGGYSVAVKKDKQDERPVVAGQGVAAIEDQRTLLRVTLHLENVPAGTYYLSTTYDSDEATYYYPLRIVP